MKKITLGMIILLVLLLGGCEEFFSFNAFEEFDDAPVPTSDDLANMEGDEAISSIEDGLESGSLLDAINDPDNPDADTLKATVKTTLSGIYDDPDATTEEKQKASTLSTEITLKTTVTTSGVSSNDVSNNLVSASGSILDAVTDDNPDNDPTEQELVETMVTGIFKDPAGAPLPVEEIEVLLKGFTDAKASTDAFVASLDSDGDGTNEIAEDISIGEVSQTGLLVLAVSTITADSNNDGSTDDEIQELAAYIANPDSATEPAGMSNLQTELENPDSNLSKLLKASGFESLMS